MSQSTAIRRLVSLGAAAIIAAPVAVLAAPSVVAADAAVARKATYKWCLKVLPHPPGFTSVQASDVNNHGLVVGSAYDGNRTRAVIWRKGTFHVLPSGGTSSTAAVAVNDHGVIVGRGDDHALVWRHGKVKQLPERGGYATALDINNHGAIVGQSFESQPVVWRHGKLKRLPVFGEFGYGWVYGIDDAGFKVGADDVLAYGWRNGAIQNLDFPNDDFEFGLADKVNNGVAVGQGDDGSTYAVPIIWDHSTKAKRLWFPQDVDDAAWASDINNHRQIVGAWDDASSSRQFAVTWIDGQFRKLPAAGTYAWADAVSDTGLVVGGRDDDAVIWRRC